MQNNTTRRGKTQKEKNVVSKKQCHSRRSLSGIYNACCCKTEEKALLNRYVEDPRQKPSGMTPNLMGFTLIELLVVVLIIGILAAVAVPQYQKAVRKSRLAEAKIILKVLSDAEDVYALQNKDCGTYSLADLDLGFPLNEEGDVITKNWRIFIGDCSGEPATERGGGNCCQMIAQDNEGTEITLNGNTFDSEPYGVFYIWGACDKYGGTTSNGQCLLE